MSLPLLTKDASLIAISDEPTISIKSVDVPLLVTSFCWKRSTSILSVIAEPATVTVRYPFSTPIVVTASKNSLSYALISGSFPTFEYAM